MKVFALPAIYGFIMLITSAAALSSCGFGEGKQRVATPLPRGYARIQVCDSVFTPVEGIPVYLEANASATTVAGEKEGWIDIVYPRYGGAIHLTVTEAADSADLNKIVASRYERIMVNLGDNNAEQLEITAPASGAVTTILTGTGAQMAPVQFVSVRGLTVVSGAFSFARRPESADSVAPIVQAVRRDLIHASKQLR